MSSSDSENENENEQIVMGVNVTQFNKPDYSNPMVIEHQKSFEEWLFSKFTKKATSYVLTLAEVDYVRDVLRGNKTITDSNKRLYLIKNNYFYVYI